MTDSFEKPLALNPPTQSDTAWKRALERWFQPFLECFWPDIAAEIDWAQPLEELSQELYSFTNASCVGNQLVDKLYKVHSPFRENYLVLLHVEIQGNKENNFAERLFEYGYRIYDRYKLPLMTLVVLSDDNENWQPDAFQHGAWYYNTIQYTFQSVKLLHWKGQEERLLKSRNPFENLIAIYLTSRRTRNSPKKRFEAKLECYKHLIQQDWEEDDIFSFVTFLDGVMRLPAKLELCYHKEVTKVEKEMNVNYLTNAEYFGHQAGLQQGHQNGLKEGIEKGMQKGSWQEKHTIAKNLLLDGLSSQVIAKATGLSLDEVEALR